VLTSFKFPYVLVRRGWHSFAQLNERFDLARRTHSISVYTEGMLAMETTLVGVIRVNPKQLLEEGIRRELVVQIARAMDEVLVFNKAKPGDLEQRLAFLAQKLDGFRRSFECASRKGAYDDDVASNSANAVFGGWRRLATQTSKTMSTFTRSRSGKRS